MRLYRLCLHSIEELREILAEATVVLGPHQQIDRAETVLLGEEIKHTRFAIHDRDRTYAVELVSKLSALLQAAQPAVRLALLQRLVLFRLAVGGLILDVRNPERNACAVDDQRRMHVQAERASSTLVLTDQPQARATGMLGEVQVGAVLQAQHHLLSLHALERAGAVRRQDVLGRQLGIVRLVDQAIVAPHQCLVGLRSRRKGSHWRVGLYGDALHQAPAQAYITQRRTAKLLLGPLGAVQSLARTQRRDRLASCQAELLSPSGLQRIHVDRLHWHLHTRWRKATAPAGFANKDPVRCLETGTGMAATIDKGLHQQGGVTVTPCKVVSEAAQTHSQHLRGQVVATHAGPDEKPAHRHDAMQLLFAQGRVPADPAIARCQHQR